MLYNIFWTSWPCIFTYVFDRDVDSKTSLKYPVLYGAGPKSVYFNFKEFWKWMILALFHGWVCFFVPVIGLNGVSNASGIESAHWITSSISFTLCLTIVTYKLFLESYFWSVLSLTTGALSMILFYAMVFMINSNGIAIMVQPQLNGVFNILITDKRFWILNICVPFLSLIPDLAFQLYSRILYPSPVDIEMLVMKNPELRPTKYIAEPVRQSP
jgi:magnesium-transporting ATPase (P-type)